MHLTNGSAVPPIDWKGPDRPGLAGIGVGLAVFLMLLAIVALAMGFIAPDAPVLQGVIGSFAGGIAGLGGFAAAYFVKRSGPSAIGLQPSHARWYLAAAILALGGYLLSLLIIVAHAKIIGTTDTSQAILHAAAQGGVLPFLFALLGGAHVTPLGEELLFRGVIANALNRYGALAGVGLSAIIFGVAHGTGVIMWVAVMMGMLSGALFRKTGSVWPSVLLHMVYNGLHSVGSALS
jgi:uncharacterized protein